MKKKKTMSGKGINTLKKMEYFVDHIYNDRGRPAIGYGINLSPSEVEKYKDGITEQKAEEMLLEHLRDKGVEDTINVYVKPELSQNQFDALCCFIYNVGIGAFRASTMLKLLNENKLGEAADQFDVWVKSKNLENGLMETLPGLVDRRKKEKALFLET